MHIGVPENIVMVFEVELDLMKKLMKFNNAWSPVIRLLLVILFLGFDIYPMGKGPNSNPSSQMYSAKIDLSSKSNSKSGLTKSSHYSREADSSDDNHSTDSSNQSSSQDQGGDVIALVDFKTKLKTQSEQESSSVQREAIREYFAQNPDIKNMFSEIANTSLPKIEIPKDYKPQPRPDTGSQRVNEIKERLRKHGRLTGHPALPPKTEYEIEMEKLGKERREEYAQHRFHRHPALADQFRDALVKIKNEKEINCEKIKDIEVPASVIQHIGVVVQQTAGVENKSKQLNQDGKLSLLNKIRTIYQIEPKNNSKNQSSRRSWYFSWEPDAQQKAEAGKTRLTFWGDGSFEDYGNISFDEPDKELTPSERTSLNLFLKKFGFSQEQINAYLDKKTEFPNVSFEDIHALEKELAQSGIEPVSTLVIGFAWVIGSGVIEWAGISVGLSVFGVYIGAKISRALNHEKVKDQDKEAKKNKEEEFSRNRPLLDMPLGVKNQNEADITVGNVKIEGEVKGTLDLNKYFNPKKDEPTDGSICPQTQEQQNPGGTIIIDPDKKPNEKPKEEESKKTENINKNDGKKPNNSKEKDSESSKQPNKGQEKGPVKDAASDKKARPNGTYHDAPYHGSVGNSTKSKRPDDGQTALDNSVEIDGKKGRIGISNDEFVVLYPTDEKEKLFHGHVRVWKDLTPGMQKALRKAGYANGKGKILK